jgi:hypothetical protein
MNFIVHGSETGVVDIPRVATITLNCLSSGIRVWSVSAVIRLL